MLLEVVNAEANMAMLWLNTSVPGYTETMIQNKHLLHSK